MGRRQDDDELKLRDMQTARRGRIYGDTSPDRTKTRATGFKEYRVDDEDSFYADDPQPTSRSRAPAPSRSMRRTEPLDDWDAPDAPPLAFGHSDSERAQSPRASIPRHRPLEGKTSVATSVAMSVANSNWTISDRCERVPPLTQRVAPPTQKMAPLTQQTMAPLSDVIEGLLARDALLQSAEAERSLAQGLAGRVSALKCMMVRLDQRLHRVLDVPLRNFLIDMRSSSGPLSSFRENMQHLWQTWTAKDVQDFTRIIASQVPELMWVLEMRLSAEAALLTASEFIPQDLSVIVHPAVNPSKRTAAWAWPPLAPVVVDVFDFFDRLARLLGRDAFHWTLSATYTDAPWDLGAAQQLVTAAVDATLDAFVPLPLPPERNMIDHATATTKAQLAHFQQQLTAAHSNPLGPQQNNTLGQHSNPVGQHSNPVGQHSNSEAAMWEMLIRQVGHRTPWLTALDAGLRARENIAKEAEEWIRKQRTAGTRVSDYCLRTEQAQATRDASRPQVLQTAVQKALADTVPILADQLADRLADKTPGRIAAALTPLAQQLAHVAQQSIQHALQQLTTQHAAQLQVSQGILGTLRAGPGHDVAPISATTLPPAAAAAASPPASAPAPAPASAPTLVPAPDRRFEPTDDRRPIRNERVLDDRIDSQQRRDRASTSTTTEERNGVVRDDGISRDIRGNGIPRDARDNGISRDVRRDARGNGIPRDDARDNGISRDVRSNGIPRDDGKTSSGSGSGSGGNIEALLRGDPRADRHPSSSSSSRNGARDAEVRTYFEQLMSFHPPPAVSSGAVRQ